MEKRMVVGAALICALGVSCGEPSESAKCGPGTTKVNGVCQISDGGGGNSSGPDSGGASGTGGGGANTGGSGTGGDANTDGDGNTGGASSNTGGSGTGGDANTGGASANTGGSGTGGNANTSGASANTGGSGTGGEAGGGGAGGGESISTEPFECGSRDVTGATQVHGNIVENTTWSGLIHVIGDVSVRNEATLTIEPGTKIIVGHDLGIDFGGENSHPTLLAEGTPDAPILFCGETDTPGYWESLSFQAGVDPDSVLRNVLIQEAGGAGAALVVDAPVLLQGVQVIDSGNVGVEASDFGTGSTALSVHNAGQYAGRATSQRAVDWPDDLDFAGNLYDRIQLSFTDLSESVYFEAKGAGFVQQNTFALAEGGEGLTVSFGPGIAYESSVELDLGAATLQVEGTEADPVLFSGLVSVSGGTIQHASFSRPGSNRGTLTLNGAVSLQDVAFDQLVLLGEGSFAPDSHGIRTVDSQPRLVLITSSCAAVNTLPLDTEIPADGRIGLACEIDSEPVSLVNVGGEYDISEVDPPDSGESVTIEADVVAFVGAWGVESGATLTIEPGVRLKLNSTFVVFGSLSAQGESDAPVVFEPSLSGWLGFQAHEGSSVTLDHAVFDGVSAGGEIVPPNAAIRLFAPASVTNTTISNSEVWGLLHTAEDTTDYSVSNTFINNALGDIGTL